MPNRNYKGELFIQHGELLLEQLEGFAAALKTNMPSVDKSFLVSQIIQERSLNRVFVDVVPNFLEHKYHKNEHNGLYAFAVVEGKNADFKYIGISKTIRKRFNDHLRSKYKNSASWAFLMAQTEEKEGVFERMKEKQLEMHLMRFTFLHIDNPYLRSMAEIYCANKLKSYWNSFDTH